MPSDRASDAPQTLTPEMILAASLIQLRQLRLSDVNKALGIRPSSLSPWLRGAEKMLSARRVELLLSYLGLDILKLRSDVLHYWSGPQAVAQVKALAESTQMEMRFILGWKALESHLSRRVALVGEALAIVDLPAGGSSWTELCGALSSAKVISLETQPAPVFGSTPAEAARAILQSLQGSALLTADLRNALQQHAGQTGAADTAAPIAPASSGFPVAEFLKWQAKMAQQARLHGSMEAQTILEHARTLDEASRFILDACPPIDRVLPVPTDALKTIADQRQEGFEGRLPDVPARTLLLSLHQTVEVEFLSPLLAYLAACSTSINRLGRAARLLGIAHCAAGKEFSPALKLPADKAILHFDLRFTVHEHQGVSHEDAEGIAELMAHLLDLDSAARGLKPIRVIPWFTESDPTHKRAEAHFWVCFPLNLLAPGLPPVLQSIQDWQKHGMPVTRDEIKRGWGGGELECTYAR